MRPYVSEHFNIFFVDESISERIDIIPLLLFADPIQTLFYLTVTSVSVSVLAVDFEFSQGSLLGDSICLIYFLITIIFFRVVYFIFGNPKNKKKCVLFIETINNNLLKYSYIQYAHDKNVYPGDFGNHNIRRWLNWRKVAL